MRAEVSVKPQLLIAKALRVASHQRPFSVELLKMSVTRKDKNSLVAGSRSRTRAGLAGPGTACDGVAIVTSLTALASRPGGVVETLLLVRRQMRNEEVRSLVDSSEIKAGKEAERRRSQRLPDSCRSPGHSRWRGRGSCRGRTCPGRAQSSTACSLRHTPATPDEEGT